MTPVKIFLASSGELRTERDGVFKIVADINKQHPHLHLEIVEWEIGLPSGNYSGQRIQDAINPLLEDCQIAYVLFLLQSRDLYDSLNAFELYFKDDLHKHLREVFPPDLSVKVQILESKISISSLPPLQPHFTAREKEFDFLHSA